MALATVGTGVSGRVSRVRYLLDTHIWLWSLLDPRRLTTHASKALEDPESELWLSPISLWELSVLEDRGRVKLTDPFEAWVEQALAIAPVRQAPVTLEIALATRRPDLEHHDPADRFIAATALVHDLTLIAADRRLIGTAQIRILANR